MLGNDFVMMAIFTAVPVIGAIAMFFVLKEDAADPRHKSKLHDTEIDSETLKP